MKDKSVALLTATHIAHHLHRIFHRCSGLHHLSGLLELSEQAVYLLKGSTGARSNTPATRAIDYRGVNTLLFSH